MRTGAGLARLGDAAGDFIMNLPPAVRTAGAGVLIAIGAIGMIVAITIPLDLQQQLTFGIAAFAAAFVMHKLDPSRRTTVAIAILSAAVSTRYIYWRTTETLTFDNPLSLVLGLGLYMAELYAWLILIFGYIQCIWPLKRHIREIQGTPEEWPTVDVYVPTYNETIELVTDTVLAAMSMDYPADRFKVWICDDGRRPEFEALAREVGCGYIIRDNNMHAKAGNLNHAMSVTDGELLCIFDCDHVATRAFLQFTVGWFQADPKLALIQTPHFFYSPDPVQRNIAEVRDIQGEGSLFYGVVQEGNDFWNATFFCGSCAIIRRRALMATNGFAGETVTEDAHTALKLQRMGWNTAYLNVRLSAGLATERLALHIGQRARWARGMTQIFRIDNPMLKPGLSFTQRLCYLNAMMAFQFPLPRIVFLTSPLCYLLMGQNIIHASPMMILAYAGPHLVFANFANERVQGKYGRSLWSEVYEALICFQLVGPAVLPLFNPKAGKFNVTDKGGLLEESYFDWRSLRPQLITMGLLILGILVGFGKVLFGVQDVSMGTVVLNVFWSLYSLMTLTVVCVVGRERRQVRVHLRAEAQLPATIYFEDGHILSGTTHDISMGGVSVTLPDLEAANGRRAACIEIEVGDRPYMFPVEPVTIRGGRMTMRFTDLSLENRRGLVRVVFGRADAWPSGDDAPLLTFSKALGQQVRAASLLLPWNRPENARKLRKVKAKPAPAPAAEPAAAVEAPREKALAAAVVAALMLLVSALWPAAPAQAQRTGVAAPAATETPAAAPQVGARRVSLTLKDLGIEQPLQLVGTLGEAGIPYNVRADEVVTQASLTLNFAYSPQLLPDLSQMVVLLNNEVVATIPLVRDGAGGVTLTIPIDAGLFTARNRLNFRFIGHYTRDCEDPLHSTLWANVSNVRTRLNLTLQRLNTGANLARLPAPFFDASDPAKLRLPFVFTESPSNAVLQAAAATASYFGMAASFRGFAFPVAFFDAPPTEAIVFARSGARLGRVTLPEVEGPGLLLVQNPNNPFTTLLVVTGRTDAEILAAARVLATSPSSLSGTRAIVTPVAIPQRKAYDGPRWLDVSKPVRLGDLVALEQLEGQGLRPGLLSIPFRTPPDLFFWPRKGATVDLAYRYPGGTWLDFRMSRLDVLVNGKYLRSFPLVDGAATAQIREALGGQVARHSGTVDLPAYNVFGQNQLQFYFDLRVAKKGSCQGEVPGNIRTGIDADSKLDLSGARHFARLPDLAFFASAGFPYSRMGDQSETVAVLSQQPTPAEIETFLTLMGRISDASGIPATSVAVVRPGDTSAFEGRDVIVVGTVGMAAALPALFEGAPVRVDGGRLRVASSNAFERVFERFGSNVSRDAPEKVDQVMVSQGDISSMISWRSPYDSDRVVTALIAASPARLPALVASFTDPRSNYTIQGDLAIAANQAYASYRVGDAFWVGDLPIVIHALWWASENPVSLAVVLVLASLILGTGAWFLLKALERRRLRDLGQL